MKNKSLKLLIVIFYIVVHFVLSTVTMPNTGIAVFAVWMFPESFIAYFYGLIAFAVLAIDTIAYLQIIKKGLISRFFQSIMLIADIVIAAFSTITFGIVNIYLAFAKAGHWNLSEAIFYVFGLAQFAVLLSSFIVVRIKLFKVKKKGGVTDE